MLQVGDDVGDVLGAYRKANGVRLDACVEQLLLVHLRVCGGSGVDNERLNVGNVSQQREQLERFGEFLSLLSVALDLE